MSEDVFCDRCGKKMEGPVTGIGYWCADLECGSDELKKVRQEFKNSKTFTQSELDDLLKECATEFYPWWCNNQVGQNIYHGFDAWWKINKSRFLVK